MKRSLLRDYGFLIGVAGVIVAFDQWTKYLVRTYLAVGESGFHLNGFDRMRASFIGIIQVQLLGSSPPGVRFSL